MMAFKDLSAGYTECCMELENLHLMPMPERYPIKPPSTTYTNSYVTPTALFQHANAQPNSA